MGDKKKADEVVKTVLTKLNDAKKADKEEDCECYAEAHTKKTCPPVRKVTHPLRYYEFTQEEIRALEECDHESFYQRCVPLSTVLATATYMAVKSGYLKRNPHFGVYPKLGVAVFLGYVIGRFSYMWNCDTKLRSLPDPSYLGKIMRKYYEDKNKSPK